VPLSISWHLQLLTLLLLAQTTLQEIFTPRHTPTSISSCAKPHTPLNPLHTAQRCEQLVPRSSSHFTASPLRTVPTPPPNHSSTSHLPPPNLSHLPLPPATQSICSWRLLAVSFHSSLILISTLNIPRPVGGLVLVPNSPTPCATHIQPSSLVTLQPRDP
jgi:hypothetical protein